MAADDDLGLLARIAARDQQALADFYRRHESRVYSFALRRLSDPHAAADVVMETMMAVWNGAAGFRGGSQVTTWLLGIAHRKTVDLIRRRSRHDAEPLDFDVADDSGDFAAALEAAEDGAQLKRCIEALPGSQRDVLHLAFFEDLSYPEIARVVDCPEGTVKTRVFHAKKRLKRCLETLTGVQP